MYCAKNRKLLPELGVPKPPKNNQEAHHQVKSFKDEYHAFLETFVKSDICLNILTSRGLGALSYCIAGCFAFRMFNALCILRRLLWNHTGTPCIVLGCGGAVYVVPIGTVKYTLDNNNKVTGIEFDVPNDDFWFYEINGERR